MRLKPVHLTRQLVLVVFQFHKGAIKTFAYTPLNEGVYGFNSIKVRLKLSDEEVETSAVLVSIP